MTYFTVKCVVTPFTRFPRWAPYGHPRCPPTIPGPVPPPGSPPRPPWAEHPGAGPTPPYAPTSGASPPGAFQAEQVPVAQPYAPPGVPPLNPSDFFPTPGNFVNPPFQKTKWKRKDHPDYQPRDRRYFKMRKTSNSSADGCCYGCVCKQQHNKNVTNSFPGNPLQTQRPLQEPASDDNPSTCVTGPDDDDKQLHLTRYFYPVRRKVWREVLVDCMFLDEARDFSVTEEEREAELKDIHISLLPESNRSKCFLKPGPWNNTGMSVDLDECLKWTTPWGEGVGWSPTR